MQSDGYHNDADILKFLGTMGGKVNDEQRQFDVINNIDSNREGSTDKSETEYTADGHFADSNDADSECFKVYKMRFADFRNKLVENFDIQWKQNKIQWPSRTGMGNTPNLLKMKCTFSSFLQNEISRKDFAPKFGNICSSFFHYLIIVFVILFIRCCKYKSL